MRFARKAAAGAAVALAVALVLSPATPAAAVVDVGDDLHGDYDGCIAKFTAAGKRDLVDKLDASKHVFKFRKSGGTVSNPDWWNKEDASNGKGTGGTTHWNPNDTTTLPGGLPRDKCSDLYHEMSHLADYDDGKNRGDYTCWFMLNGVRTSSGVSPAEVKATRKENEYRAKQSGLTERNTYDGTSPLPASDSDCLPPPPPRPSGGCSVSCAIGSGDPHLKTYDGLWYDFQAVGEFVLTLASADDLQIQARTKAPQGLRTVSLFSAVAADVAGDRVGIYRVPTGLQLRIGGASATGSRSLPHGGAVEVFDDGSVDVRWPDGSVLTVHPSGARALTVMADLAQARRGKVSGLFGNFDGQVAGDAAVRDGAAISPTTYDDLYPKYADSWRVTQATSLFDYESGQSTATLTDRSMPERPIAAKDLPNRATAEAICRQAGVTERAPLEGCILDVGLTGDIGFAAVAELTQRSLVAAGATTLTVTKPSGTATLTFPGQAGQRVVVQVVSSNVADQCGVLDLLNAGGQFLSGGCIIGGRGFIDGTVLPATATYTVRFRPTGVGQASVRLFASTDQILPITPGGPETTATLTQPGAVARMVFTATAGQKVFVDAPASTLADQCGVLTLRNSAGEFVAGGCIIGGRGYIDGHVLPSAGQYTVWVDPAEAGIGTTRLRLIVDTDQLGTIIKNGPAVTATVGQPGAVSRFSFTGTKGQTISVSTAGSTLPDQCGVLSLLDPAGNVVTGGCIIDGKGGINPYALPASGQYVILVDPADRTTGTAQLQLHT
ncbi:MAG: VWD domain-containing protein [Micromonosporaceae bacterium]